MFPRALPAQATHRSHRVRRHVRHARRWRIRRHWSPWKVSSYDNDPGVGDNTEGEDLAVRQAALQALGHWNGSIVVVDPDDGRILTVVNQKLAFSGAYRPCSTFKPIVALAALRQDIITPYTRIQVGRHWSMNVTSAIAHSNNEFFYKLGQRVGFRLLSRYAHEFGLGQKAGWDILLEVPGEFPTVPPTHGGVGDLAYLGKGIEVTSLQWAAVASAIANGGTLYYLQYPRTRQQLEHFEPRVRRRLTDLRAQIPTLRGGMAAAVSYGTARLANNGGGEQIFGKTGTCSEDGARLGWFLSYSSPPPQYVVVVLLRGGRPMDGPHAAEIAGRLYKNLWQAHLTQIQAGKTLLSE